MRDDSPHCYALRLAQPSDVDWLVMLREQTMAQHFEASGERLSHEEHRRRVLDNFASIRIIIVQNSAIGMFKVVRKPDHWRIMQLQLRADFQRRGIGTKVVKDLLAEAKQQQVPVTLSVLKANPARRLYARLGMQVTAETADSCAMRCDP